MAIFLKKIKQQLDIARVTDALKIESFWEGYCRKKGVLRKLQYKEQWEDDGHSQKNQNLSKQQKAVQNRLFRTPHLNNL